MNRTLSTQATAFGLAALVTFSLLIGIQQLAAPVAGSADVLAERAAPSAPVQVVVITAKRVSA
jgi:hypothetical protein